ncbi:MAG: helix-turn-helix domain-containing protein [Propionibacteriaceae bacterium]|jgi:excisionase family DNA binding protein|nr:helix-turn-helix domain-containing protein [Propionibacteriaceae bacterium]
MKKISMPVEAAASSQISPVNQAFLTIQSATKYTDLSVKTLRRAIANRELKAHTVCRRLLLKVSDIDAWVTRDTMGN